MKTAKQKFQFIYFTIFFAVVVVCLFLVINTILKNKNEKLPLEFRTAITGIKFQHGSSFLAFVDLSNGDEYLITLPQTGIIVGDSIIKIKNEPFFRVVKSNGKEVGKSSLYGTIYRE